jgi:hypothetical protein
MNKLKCPFCQQKLLQEYNRQRDAVIYHCTHCYFQGDGILWQELIRTRKALDVAVRAIETIKYSKKSDAINLRHKANKALIEIYKIKDQTALEQRE